MGGNNYYGESEEKLRKEFILQVQTSQRTYSLGQYIQEGRHNIFENSYQSG